MKIQHFKDINDSHLATGFSGRTDIPDFHIFTIEETYPQTRQVMPPYTFGFYQIVLLENSDDASIQMNTSPLSNLSDSITFASPDHVLAWTRGSSQRGFITYFKEEFLLGYVPQLEIEFPFFHIGSNNLLVVDEAAKPILINHFTQLLHTFHTEHPYRIRQLQARLLIVLYESKRLYDEQQRSFQQVPPRQALAVRFQQLVRQHFLSLRSVDAYANLLGVSPDYLSETIKSTTGKNAHGFIADRLLLETKTLLAYSDQTIAEIAYYLGYTESTHFGRFFRHHTGLTPLAWRRHHKSMQNNPSEDSTENSAMNLDRNP